MPNGYHKSTKMSFGGRSNVQEKQLGRWFNTAKRSGVEGKFWSEISEALEKKELAPNDFSIRGLFESFVEDGRSAIDALMNPNNPSSTSLEEANVMTTDFTNISGQIFYNSILSAYDDAMRIGGKLAKTVPTQLSGEKIAGISNLGDVSQVVAEGAPYPEATVSEDYIETPATDKRGLIVPVTKESIFFDRTNVLLMRCSEVGRALGHSKEKRIIDAALGVTNNYNRKGVGIKNTYSNAAATGGDANVDWINEIAANPLENHANVNAIKMLLAYMIDPNTGEPSPADANMLLVPKELEEQAMQLKAATAINLLDTSRRTMTMNPMSGVEIISSPHVRIRNGGNSADWFFGNFPEAITYQENWPMTVQQSGADSSVGFTHDIVVRYKASERGTVAIVNPRVVAKSIAA